MKNLIGLALLILSGTLFTFAQQEESFEYELGYTINPLVYSASQKPIFLNETPSTVKVIYGEELWKMGVTSITDIFRIVSGVNVAQLCSSGPEVNIRGLADAFSNRILVTLDGRSTALGLHNITFWESLPVVLSDIERIEIVKGPGSAVSGANAFFGIINIITKTPEKLLSTPSTQISTTFGNQGTKQASLLQAGAIGKKWTYKYSLGTQQKESFASGKNQMDLQKGSMLVNYSVDSETDLNLSMGITDGNLAIVTGPGTGLSPVDVDKTTYCNLNYESPQILAHLYWNQMRGKMSFNAFERLFTSLYNLYGTPMEPYRYSIEENTYEVEIKHILNWEEIHSTTYGCSYRSNEMNSELLKSGEQMDIAGFFAEDILKLREDLTLFLGFRWDHNNQTRSNKSPRISLLYNLNEWNTLRYTYSKAFRIPTLTELYLNLHAFGYYFYGNPDLKTEKISSHEVTWRMEYSEKMTVQWNTFYNTLEEIIPPVVETTRNLEGKFFIYGMEWEFKYKLSEAFSGLFNYTYIDFDEKNSTVPIYTQLSETTRWDDPLHTANACARYSTSSFSANLWINYVRNARISNHSSYTQWNTSLNHPFSENLEASLSVFNLWNQVHYENELYMQEDLEESKIGRSVYVNLRYRC